MTLKGEVVVKHESNIRALICIVVQPMRSPESNWLDSLRKLWWRVPIVCGKQYIQLVYHKNIVSFLVHNSNCKNRTDELNIVLQVAKPMVL